MNLSLWKQAAKPLFVVVVVIFFCYSLATLDETAWNSDIPRGPPLRSHLPVTGLRTVMWEFPKSY